MYSVRDVIAMLQEFPLDARVVAVGNHDGAGSLLVIDGDVEHSLIVDSFV